MPSVQAIDVSSLAAVHRSRTSAILFVASEYVFPMYENVRFMTLPVGTKGFAAAPLIPENGTELMSERAASTASNWDVNMVNRISAAAIAKK